MDVERALAEAGIHLRSLAPGNHYSTCPQCSEGRHGANRKKLCLSVAIGPTPIASGSLVSGEAVWNCHHCGWSGGTGSKGESNHGTQRDTRGGAGVAGHRPRVSESVSRPQRFGRRYW